MGVGGEVGEMEAGFRGVWSDAIVAGGLVSHICRKAYTNTDRSDSLNLGGLYVSMLKSWDVQHHKSSSPLRALRKH